MCALQPHTIRALSESVFLGKPDQFGAAIDLHLLVDVVEVHLDRAVGDAQPVGDFLVRESLGGHLHDVDFARREQLGDFGALRLAATSLPSPSSMSWSASMWRRLELKFHP